MDDAYTMRVAKRAEAKINIAKAVMYTMEGNVTNDEINESQFLDLIIKRCDDIRDN